MWKGKVLTVEYDLFTAGIKQDIKEGLTKDQAIDQFFDICSYGENPPRVLTKQAVA